MWMLPVAERNHLIAVSMWNNWIWNKNVPRLVGSRPFSFLLGISLGGWMVVAGGGYWHNLAVALFPFVANLTVACVTNLTFIFIAQFDWFDLEFQLGFELIAGILKKSLVGYKSEINIFYNIINKIYQTPFYLLQFNILF